MRSVVSNSVLLLLFTIILSSLFFGRWASADASNNDNKCRWEPESGRRRELRYVQAVWRHGDRAPKRRPYSSDVHGVEKWPRGWAHLTSLGMQQMKELGEFMRHRYRHFVGGGYSKFNETEVFVRSSEASRAIVSAQAVLNGLYPPRNRTDGFDDHFDKELDWQPLPIHSTGYGIPDPLLKSSAFNCPTYQRLYEPIKRRVAATLETRFNDIFIYISAKINGGKRLPYHKVIQLNDINREIAHGLEPQPNWAVRRRWPNHRNETTLQVVTRMARIYRTAQFNESALAYLRGGFLLGDWLQRAISILRNESVTDLLVDGSVDMKEFLHFGKERRWSLPTRLSLNSAHDGTLMSLLYALNVTNENGELVIRYNVSRKISAQYYGGSVRNESDKNLNNNTNYGSFSNVHDNIAFLDAKNNNADAKMDENNSNNKIYITDNILGYSGGKSREGSVGISSAISKNTVGFVDPHPDINAMRNGQNVENAAVGNDDDDMGMSNFDDSWRFRVDDSNGLVIPAASCVFMEVYRECDTVPEGLLTVKQRSKMIRIATPVERRDVNVPHRDIHSGKKFFCFEMQRNSRISLYVRRLRHMQRIAIPDCGEPCPLATFVNMFRRRAIFEEKNVYKKCKADYCKQSTASPKE